MPMRRNGKDDADGLFAHKTDPPSLLSIPHLHLHLHLFSFLQDTSFSSFEERRNHNVVNHYDQLHLLTNPPLRTYSPKQPFTVPCRTATTISTGHSSSLHYDPPPDNITEAVPPQRLYQAAGTIHPLQVRCRQWREPPPGISILHVS
jgi:hypothetical protein